MKTDNFAISVIDIMGILDSGISVSISIEYNGNFYEGTYWYNENNSLITVSDELEEAIQYEFSNIEDYDVLLASLDTLFPKNLFSESIKELSDIDVDLNSYYAYYLEKLNSN